MATYMTTYFGGVFGREYKKYFDETSTNRHFIQNPEARMRTSRTCHPDHELVFPEISFFRNPIPRARPGGTTSPRKRLAAGFV
jgi:hypothetical protein